MFLVPNGTRFKKRTLLSFGPIIQLFSAEDVHDGKRYLIKEIALEKINYSQTMQMFKEFEALRRITFPFIITLHECYKVKSRKLVMVFEFPKNGCLRDKIKEKDSNLFVEKQIERWIIQLCLSIKCLHSSYIIHRNLKTEGIYLDNKNDIKLGDFNYIETQTSQTEIMHSDYEISEYSAPEVLTKGLFSYKSDIWALGVIFYWMMVRKSPFEFENKSDLTTAILNDKPQRISSSYSMDMRGFIKLFFIKDHNQRPDIFKLVQKPYFKSILSKYPDLAEINMTDFDFNKISFNKLPQSFNSLKVYRSSQHNPTSLKEMLTKSFLKGNDKNSFKEDRDHMKLFNQIPTHQNLLDVFGNSNRPGNDYKIDILSEGSKKDLADLSSSSQYTSDEEEEEKISLKKSKILKKQSNNKRDPTPKKKSLTHSAIKILKENERKSFLCITQLNSSHNKQKPFFTKLTNTKISKQEQQLNKINNNTFQSEKLKQLLQRRSKAKGKSDKGFRKVLRNFSIKNKDQRFFTRINNSINNESFNKTSASNQPLRHSIMNPRKEIKPKRINKSLFGRPMKISLKSQNFTRMKKRFNFKTQVQHQMLKNKFFKVKQQETENSNLPKITKLSNHKYVYLDYKNQKINVDLDNNQRKKISSTLKKHYKNINFDQTQSRMLVFLKQLNLNRIGKLLRDEQLLFQELKDIFKEELKGDKNKIYFKLLFKISLFNIVKPI